MSDQIILCDVSPRDGIQNEKIMLSSAQKLELIHRLADAGMPWIEVASFASPKWVPQMADAEEVFRAASQIPGIRPIVLVLNDRGYDRAVAAGARYIRLVVAATDTMNQKNANALPDATMASYLPIFERAQRDHVELTGTIATAFGCPFEGAVDPNRVLALAAKFIDAGAAEVDFADTVGMAVPPQIDRILIRARKEFPRARLGIHLHNTRNLGLANAYAAVRAAPTCSTLPPVGLAAVLSRPRPLATFPWTTWSSCSKAWASPPVLTLISWLKPRAGSRKCSSTRSPRCSPKPALAGSRRRRWPEILLSRLIAPPRRVWTIDFC